MNIRTYEYIYRCKTFCTYRQIFHPHGTAVTLAQLRIYKQRILINVKKRKNEHGENFRNRYKTALQKQFYFSSTINLSFYLVFSLQVFSRPYWVVRSRLWYDFCPSVVCLSVTFCIVAKRYVVEGWRWYRWIGRW